MLSVPVHLLEQHGQATHFLLYLQHHTRLLLVHMAPVQSVRGAHSGYEHVKRHCSHKCHTRMLGWAAAVDVPLQHCHEFTVLQFTLDFVVAVARA